MPGPARRFSGLGKKKRDEYRYHADQAEHSGLAAAFGPRAVSGPGLTPEEQFGLWLNIPRLRLRLEATVGEGTEAAFRRGKRPLAWYDALCQLQEAAAAVKREADLERLDDLISSRGGMPWTS